MESGLNSIGLRPHVVYGAGRDRGLTAAPTFAMEAAAQGLEYTIAYSGRCEMQYAPDVAAAFIAAARASFTGATVVNVPGTSVLIDEVVTEIERVIPEVAAGSRSAGRRCRSPTSSTPARLPTLSVACR